MSKLIIIALAKIAFPYKVFFCDPCYPVVYLDKFMFKLALLLDY